MAVFVPALVLGGITPSWVLRVVGSEVPAIPRDVDQVAFNRLADSSRSKAPTVLAGTLTADETATAGTVVAYAWPNQELERTLQPGDQVSLVPVAKATADSAGRYELRLATADLPASHISDSGLVNLELVAWNATELGRTTVSVQAVTLGTERVWVDPLEAPAVAAGSRPVADARVSVAVRLAEPMVPAVTGGPDSALAVPGCGYALQSSYNAWEVVGRTTPASGQTGSASMTSTHTHTIGVGTSTSGSSGSWSANGTYSISSGFSQDWTASSSLRNYRAQVTMGKYAYTCAGVIHSYKTQARYHTGGTYTQTVTAPTYSNCVTISAGVWSRTSTSGYAHSLSAGLQATGTLGINLSASRQYSSTVKISYHQTVAKHVCGNNAVPAKAGLIDGQP
jgi:hypothetical protein